jgi:hypothetical protein
MASDAIRSLGEPNCMHSIVSCIRSAAECGTLAAVATYALTFFAALVLTATIVGIPLVLMGVDEFVRQKAEQALAGPLREAAQASAQKDERIAGLRGALDRAQARATVAAQGSGRMVVELQTLADTRIAELEAQVRGFEAANAERAANPLNEQVATLQRQLAELNGKIDTIIRTSPLGQAFANLLK